MNETDRSYTYIAKTLDAPEHDVLTFVEIMRQYALPVWQQLHERGLLASVQVLHKVGDVDLQTSTRAVRDWAYFALLELPANALPDKVLDAERKAGISVAEFSRYGVQYLSNEIAVRPARAGTAIPVPSPQWPSAPPDQLAAIEYIHIPDGFGDEYRQFMREVMGPVGAHMVERGHSFQIQIMECIRVLHHDASLPAWNRIHILWGDFNNTGSGFIEHTNDAVRAVVGPDNDVRTALSSANRYRVKPRMSTNRLLRPLCIGYQFTGEPPRRSAVSEPPS